MRKLATTLTVTALLMSFTACRQAQEKEFSHLVVRMDFTDNVMLEGTVSAIRSTQVMPFEELVEWGSVIKTLTEDGVWVKQGDTVCVLENKDLEETQDLLTGYIANGRLSYESGLSRLETQYATLEAQLRINEIQSNLSSLDSIQLAYYTPTQRRIAELNLRKARIEEAKLKREIATTKLVNETEVMKLKIQLRQYESLQERYDGLVQRLVVTSPATGLFLRKRNPDTGYLYEDGDVVRGAVGEIPSTDTMQVKMEVPEQVFKRLAVGQPVAYTFSGMPGVRGYGRIVGKSPVGRDRRNTSLTYFDVVASVDSCTGKPQPGMSANCLVTVKSLPDTLAIPIVAVFDQDSCKVVYVKQGSGYVQQEVTTGWQSSQNVVISAGITPGIQLSMIRPKDHQIKAKRFLSK